MSKSVHKVNDGEHCVHKKTKQNYCSPENAFQFNSWEPENRIRIIELIENKGEILNFRRKNAE